MVNADLEYYIQGVRACNRRILAKTITLIESVHPAHQAMSRKIVGRLLPDSGKAVRLGISGVPGAGKSTFIESLGTLLIKEGCKVAVLAVDPSSVKSGGSVMADKTRMEKLSAEENAFIRPSPSKGTLGGVAGKTRETMLVCEAAGFDVLIVETVGVGQSETTVASMVDFFLVLMLAGAGDQLQGIKKGIMEIADAIVVNKADGDNIEKAAYAKRMYEAVLHLFSPSSPTWSPPVLCCSALEMRGIEAVWQTVRDHRAKFEHSGELKALRRKQDLDWMWSLVDEGLKARFNQHPEVRKLLSKITADVVKGETTPSTAADKLLSLLDCDC